MRATYVFTFGRNIWICDFDISLNKEERARSLYSYIKDVEIEKSEKPVAILIA